MTMETNFPMDIKNAADITLCFAARLARGGGKARRVVFVNAAHYLGDVAAGSKWRKFTGTILVADLPAGLKSGFFDFELSIFEDTQEQILDSFALQEEAFCGFGGPRRRRTSWKWRNFLGGIWKTIHRSNFELSEVARSRAGSAGSRAGS